MLPAVLCQIQYAAVALQNYCEEGSTMQLRIVPAHLHGTLQRWNIKPSNKYVQQEPENTHRLPVHAEYSAALGTKKKNA